jgi:arginine decarboxylase
VIESFIKGDTVTDVLNYVGFHRAELVTRLQGAIERSVQQGYLNNLEAGRFLKFYEEALNGYTYLEDAGEV